MSINGRWHDRKDGMTGAILVYSALLRGVARSAAVAAADFKSRQFQREVEISKL